MHGGQGATWAKSLGPEEQSESQQVTGSQWVGRTEMGLGIKGTDFKEKNRAFSLSFQQV